jgi:DNA-binding Lrp family transcriptional regulator
LKTHPNIPYEDGITHIYLYCNGKINDDLDASHGKRLMEVLKYIVSGEKISSENQQVNDLEKVVSKIKKRPEVTKKYMQQWDRERHLVMDTKKDDAISAIIFNRKHGISDEETKAYIINELGLSESCADELFAQVDAEAVGPNTK